VSRSTRRADGGAAPANGRAPATAPTERKERGLDLVGEAVRQWQAHGLGTALAHMEAATALHRMRHLVVARVEQELRPLNMTFSQYEALTLLSFARRGAMPLGRMSKRLSVHPTTVTNTVDQLEARKLVERERPPEDRRRILAKITPKGRTVAAKASARLDEVRYGLEELEEDEARQIARLINDFRARIHDELSERGES
jgi:DNA-binding MarR family transcriptional regulator